MDLELLKSELVYKAVRSSGSGGQNVNKVATKVVLYFNLTASLALSALEKNKLEVFFKNRINKEGILILTAGDSRSQYRNKISVTKRLLDLITEGLKENKKRKPTVVPKSVKKKRLNLKRRTSEKKANRKPPNID
ncbi:alternative ribosome rescue aminoacyl-tRNA hydrolase ArfB [uncultured Winogradskyella sp.]|uniref:alternative ribosome rescue aminoacyl-tRNA hydrolase ArfB n=1 Tax=uncultured Winogradskyella sp. TaxID=395353 RepID=UPI0026277A40|nr:alternative ribosome rescue aminoacyl-tRNA hydrolase ArfB [uncultured Winogradskyella sp.]